MPSPKWCLQIFHIPFAHYFITGREESSSARCSKKQEHPSVSSNKLASAPLHLLRNAGEMGHVANVSRGCPPLRSLGKQLGLKGQGDTWGLIGHSTLLLADGNLGRSLANGTRECWSRSAKQEEKKTKQSSPYKHPGFEMWIKPAFRDACINSPCSQIIWA